MQTKGLIPWAIGLYIAAAILPGAIAAFFNASTAGWSDVAVTLWDLVPLIIIAGLVTTSD